MCPEAKKKKKKIIEPNKNENRTYQLKKIFKKNVLSNFPVFHTISLALITMPYNRIDSTYKGKFVPFEQPLPVSPTLV